MRKEDVKIGMKVVPHRKSGGDDIHITMQEYLNERCCFNQSDFFRRNGFLYVSGVSGNRFMLWHENNVNNGDFFDASDFEPFDKPKIQPIITTIKADLLFDKPVVEEDRDEVYIYSGRTTVYINLSLGTYGVATVNSNELKSYNKEIGQSLAFKRSFDRLDKGE